MNTCTILAVDDNEDTLDLIHETLSEHGFRVIRAPSGPEAMALLMTRQIDLVLLDLMMPNMDGFAVHEAILEMMYFIPRLAHTRVLVHTAHADHQNVARAKEQGAVAVLTKPIAPAKLLEEVQKYLAAPERANGYCATVGKEPEVSS